ncbi:MAG TPA: methyltransferase domain-containing protein [Acidimicrobiales bacterium]|nr:methyltransferase domain-containing protein [Acidimicrobiales bacterium]
MTAPRESAFSDVDASIRTGRSDPRRLIEYLDETDAGLAAIKGYIAAAIARAVPGGVVIDLGCGAGHDLSRLAAAGLHPIGVDHSAVMLDHTRRRAASVPPALVRADGERLPLGDASVDAVRVERVLEHVDDPAAVVHEIARVVRPDGTVAVFEPDLDTFTVDTDSDDPRCRDLPRSGLRVRHPAIGRLVPGLLEGSGFRVDDIVTESSFGYSVDTLPIAADAFLARAVETGHVSAAAATEWLAEQRARTAARTFRARWEKVLTVATRVA